jgi:hypothetical protein
MSIENSLERIANALEKIAGGQLNTPTEPATPTPEKTETLYTDDDVRKAVRQMLSIIGQKATEELIVKYGAKADKPRLSDVKDKNGLMNEIKTRLEE